MKKFSKKIFLLLIFSLSVSIAKAQAPTLVSIVRETPSTASTFASEVIFRARFDTTVTNIFSTDFTLNSTVGGTIDSISALSGKEYLIYVSGLSNASGTVGLGLKGVGGAVGTNNITTISYSNSSLTVNQTASNDYLNHSKIGQTFKAVGNDLLQKLTFFPKSGQHRFVGTADLKIYSGDESGGSATLLGTQTVNFTASTAASGQSFNIASLPSLTLGNTYSIVLDNFVGTGTHALSSTSSGSYTDGHAIFTGYNSSSHASFDLKIQIFEVTEIIGLALNSVAPSINESFIKNTLAVQISSFSPNTAISGTTVSIFGVFQGTVDSIRFGNVNAQSFVKVSDSLVQAVVGFGGTGSINVYTSNGIISASGFVYINTSPAQELTNSQVIANCFRGSQTTPNRCLCDRYHTGQYCSTLIIFDNFEIFITDEFNFFGPPKLFGGPIFADTNNIYEMALEITDLFYDANVSQGMTFGLGSTNMSDTTHDIGDYAFEYSYNAKGEMKTGGVVVGNGIPLLEDYKIKLVFDINAKTLNFYVAQAGSSVYAKQGTGFTNVVAAPGEQVKMYYSVESFGKCRVEIDHFVNPNLQYSPIPAEIAVFGDPLFGQIAPNGGQEVLSYAIKNLGGFDLILNNVPPISISGANASEFNITKQPEGSILSEEFTTFEVAFNPTSSGNKQAVIHVVSNDSDEGNFQFNVSGTAPAPAMTVSLLNKENVSCSGGSDGKIVIEVRNGVGNYNYSWSNNSTNNTVLDKDSIQNLSPGTYSVTVTDGNGLIDSASVNITEPHTLVAGAGADSVPSCFGFANGGATAFASGGTTPYTYTWSNAATTASITGITIGTYTVTVTDNNACTSTSSSTISQPASLMATSVVDSNITCNGFANGGATASGSGGTSPYTYTWSNSATTASITGVIAGTYSITITDNNGCTDTIPSTITEPTSLMAATAIDSNISCNGNSDGGATASGSGGTATYTYSWSNSATTASISGVIAGTYSVTITDNMGCTNNTSINLLEPESLGGGTISQ